MRHGREAKMRRIREHPEDRCVAIVRPWYPTSDRQEPCGSRFQLLVNGEQMCVKHARIEVLALLLQGKKVSLTQVARAPMMISGILRAVVPPRKKVRR